MSITNFAAKTLHILSMQRLSDSHYSISTEVLRNCYWFTLFQNHWNSKHLLTKVQSEPCVKYAMKICQKLHVRQDCQAISGSMLGLNSTWCIFTISILVKILDSVIVVAWIYLQKFSNWNYFSRFSFDLPSFSVFFQYFTVCYSEFVTNKHCIYITFCLFDFLLKRAYSRR